MDHNDYKFQLELTDDQLRLLKSAIEYWRYFLKEMQHDLERGVPIIADYDGIKENIRELNNIDDLIDAKYPDDIPF